MLRLRPGGCADAAAELPFPQAYAGRLQSVSSSNPSPIDLDQQRDVKAFAKAVESRDEARVRQLVSRPHVRAHVNDPMFAFGQRAAHMAAKNERMLETLVAAGADVNLKSDWANGPYTVLDRADEGTARWLLAHGVALTPNAAARLGWFDDLAVARPRGRSARPRARRRRAAAAARSEDRGDCRLPSGSWRRHRRALHRSQIDARPVHARRSPRRVPAADRARRDTGHLHGGHGSAISRSPPV